MREIANCNLLYDNGVSVAWGETSIKETYSWSNYKWCNGSFNGQTKYCTSANSGAVDNKTVLDSADDAATVCWGSGWRTPTIAEWTELQEKCAWEWTTQNGVNGYKVTATNGNSIFLPAAGCFEASEHIYAGTGGYYWSSSLDINNSCNVWNYSFYSDRHDIRGMGDYGRFFGQSVRPVSAGSAN